MHRHRAGNAQHQRQRHALPADAKRQQQRVPEPWQIGFHDLKIHKHPPVSAQCGASFLLLPVIDLPRRQIAHAL